jgi:hypothetical protein
MFAAVKEADVINVAALFEPSHDDVPQSIVRDVVNRHVLNVPAITHAKFTQNRLGDEKGHSRIFLKWPIGLNLRRLTGSWGTRIRT